MGFTRTKENFVCEHCGAFTVGDGYTNHCPHCLWSKHVDNEPGDREAACGAMMRPAALVGSSPDYRILHVCQGCHVDKLNKVQPEDSSVALVELARHPMPPSGQIVNLETGEDVDPLYREMSYPEANKGDVSNHR